jgi:hypothetical protein
VLGGQRAKRFGEPDRHDGAGCYQRCEALSGILRRGGGAPQRGVLSVRAPRQRTEAALSAVPTAVYAARYRNAISTAGAFIQRQTRVVQALAAGRGEDLFMANIRYGFDHCRLCGVPITPRRHDALTQWEEAQIKCKMPEKQWREEGFLAAPTKYQVFVSPSDGCCAKCGVEMAHRVAKYHLRGILSIALAVALAVFVSCVALYMRQ